jgi:hypothetical protein
MADEVYEDDVVYEDEVDEYDAVVPQPRPAVADLTTPCTLAALEKWLRDAQVLMAGVSSQAQVTTTGPNIKVA